MAEGQVVGRVSIKVTPDTSKFRRELNAKLQQIEKTIEAAIDVEPSLTFTGR